VVTFCNIIQGYTAARGKRLCSSSKRQPSTGAHSLFVSKGRGSSFPWGKTAGAWSWSFSNRNRR